MSSSNGAHEPDRPDTRSAAPIVTVAEALAAARPPRSASGWRHTFSALEERDYAVYFGGNLTFFMAMQMNQLLRGYLAFELTDAASDLPPVFIPPGELVFRP